MVARVQKQFGKSKNFHVGHANFGRSNRSFRGCSYGKGPRPAFVDLSGDRFQTGKARSATFVSHRGLCAILPDRDQSLVTSTWRLALVAHAPC